MTARHSAPANSGPRTADVSLCDVRDVEGDLVRQCSQHDGDPIVAAGLGYRTGGHHEHVRLYQTPQRARRVWISEGNITLTRTVNLYEHNISRKRVL